MGSSDGCFWLPALQALVYSGDGMKISTGGIHVSLIKSLLFSQITFFDPVLVGGLGRGNVLRVLSGAQFRCFSLTFHWFQLIFYDFHGIPLTFIGFH